MTAKVRNQIACLFFTSENAINVKYIDVQMQDGSADCGVFAVAFAATLASGGRPGAFSYCQARMRHHLLSCLERSELTPFSVQRKRRNINKVKSTVTISVYCNCRLPALKDCTMIQCLKMSRLVPCKHLRSGSERSFGIVEEVVMLSLCLNKCCFVTRREHFSFPYNHEHYMNCNYLYKYQLLISGV